jgi:dTDP-glucose pyrophosphorylase
MKGPILVVLAAGMGSRYGGLKQMDKIGRNGEVLLDYSVYDAVSSGFEKIVFIIRHDIEKDFRDLVLARMGSKVNCELAFQDPDSLIPPDIFRAAQEAGRTKPWGTGHALLCAADKIDAPFTVINADDFYGREAFAVMGKHLCGADANASSIVPYQLEKTLSPQGTVSRGVCGVENGYLVSVDELTAIEKKDGRIFNTAPDGSIRNLAPDTPVSMNFWGFPPSLLPEFKKYFDDFLKTFSADVKGQIKSECFIPKAVDHFIKNGSTKVKVLSANSNWFGVTYKEDREAAIKKIDELTAGGVYPAPLWEKL